MYTLGECYDNMGEWYPGDPDWSDDDNYLYWMAWAHVLTRQTGSDMVNTNPGYKLGLADAMGELELSHSSNTN